MKRWIFLILAIIIISIFGLIKSCQREKREVINVYTDREIEIFIGKLAKKYENTDKDVSIKINALNSLEDYDIILTDEDSKIKDSIKKKYEVKDFFEDNLVIIGRRKIDNLSQMLTSSIAIPNYKTNIGKTGLDILAKVEGFQEMAKNIQYKDDVMSSLESVDLYEVDYAFVTSKILPLAKNSEICYIFPENIGRSQILYKAYINLESNIVTENINENIQKPVEEKPQKIVLDVKSVYDSLNIKNKIDYSIFQKAYLGYVQITNKNPGVLIIIDYSKPSNEERFYVLDLNKKKLVYSTRVAHSKNSGLEIPLQFSDDPNSYQSSLGFFVTLGEYNGAYGYSLRLKGLEENINANAEDRAIVIHGGNIVEDDYIKRYGFAGRSLGCPVLPYSLAREIIDFIKHGRVLFIYGNDEEYIDNSTYLSKLAAVFEGSPKNIVEIEKPSEIQKTSPTPTVTTVATTTTVNHPAATVLGDKKENINRETVIAEANITKIHEIIKQEAKYTNNVNNNKVSYTELLKDVIQERNNKTSKIKENIENKKLNEENNDNHEKIVEQTITDNSFETKQESETTVQQNENIEENKKEERKYPEEVIKKSLGLEIKLK